MKSKLESHKPSERIEEKIEDMVKTGLPPESLDSLRQHFLMKELDAMYDMLYQVVEDFERYKYLERKKK